jgi:hypothetical protein
MFCATVKKKYSPIVSIKKSGRSYVGYFLVAGNLNSVMLGPEPDPEKRIAIFNKWLIKGLTNSTFYRRYCSICAVYGSYYQKGSNLICDNCGKTVD